MGDKETIKEEKSERWKEHVEKNINATTNPGKVWETIRSLDGRLNPGNVNDVLMDRKQDRSEVVYVENKDKANLCTKTYKKFTRLRRPRWTKS